MKMKRRLRTLVDSNRHNRRLATVGLGLVVASIALAGWLVAEGDFITGVSVLLYVVVGLLLAAIGVSPEAGTEPNQRI